MALEAMKEPKVFAAAPQKPVTTKPVPVIRYTGRLPNLTASTLLSMVLPAKQTISEPLVPDEKVANETPHSSASST